LKNDGTVWAWGYNYDGELGNGTWNSSNVPVQVSGLTSVTAIAGGGGHSLALKNDGTVWAWGYNYGGELGNGTWNSSNVPVQVSSLTGITAIAAGDGGHSLALKNDGTVWAWGDNEYGELGNGTNTNSNVPVQVSGLTGITAIAGGVVHSIAVKNDGTVWAWGNNGNGQLGNGTNTNSNLPVQVSGLTGVTSIAGGLYHSLALKNDGTVWAWGNNGNGQLGNGTFSNSNLPVQVSGLTGVTAIAGGNYHSLALKNDGTAWAWGNNDNGQLGNGTNTDSNLPVQVSGLTGVTAIAVGGLHSLALHTVVVLPSDLANLIGDYVLLPYRYTIGNFINNQFTDLTPLNSPYVSQPSPPVSATPYKFWIKDGNGIVMGQGLGTGVANDSTKFSITNPSSWWTENASAWPGAELLILVAFRVLSVTDGNNIVIDSSAPTTSSPVWYYIIGDATALAGGQLKYSATTNTWSRISMPMPFYRSGSLTNSCISLTVSGQTYYGIVADNVSATFTQPGVSTPDTLAIISNHTFSDNDIATYTLYTGDLKLRLLSEISIDATWIDSASLQLNAPISINTFLALISGYPEMGYFAFDNGEVIRLIGKVGNSENIAIERNALPRYSDEYAPSSHLAGSTAYWLGHRGDRRQNLSYRTNYPSIRAPYPDSDLYQNASIKMKRNRETRNIDIAQLILPPTQLP
jgi:hypothetical protein